MRLSEVVQAVPPSGIRRFFDIVSQMEDVISLGVGEPDFVTPWRIREAAIYSLEKGFTTYTSNWGLLELRQAVALYLDRHYGVEYNPQNEVLITVGVSEGLDLALRAVLNPGDEVVIPEPCYVSYRPCTLFAGGVPVPVPGRPEDGFAVRAEAIAAAITPRTRAILLNYPNNPVGSTIPRAELLKIAAVAALRNGNADMEEMVAQYDERRRLVVNGFHSIGLDCFEPQGAFYAFPSVRATGLSSEEFAERLLHEERVAVVPGTAFGECGE